MNEEETSTAQLLLLRELAERQESIERRLSAIEAAHLETWRKYDAADAGYRNELSGYKQELVTHALGRNLSAAARIVLLLLLLYVAYRVS
jgi:hypothetical protein